MSASSGPQISQNFTTILAPTMGAAWCLLAPVHPLWRGVQILLYSYYHWIRSYSIGYNNSKSFKVDFGFRIDLINLTQIYFFLWISTHVPSRSTHTQHVGNAPWRLVEKTMRSTRFKPHLWTRSRDDYGPVDPSKTESWEERRNWNWWKWQVTVVIGSRVQKLKEEVFEEL